MKRLIVWSYLLLLVGPSGMGAGFTSGASADRVLGQASFTTNFANTTGTSRGLNSPLGIAVDPVSGKLFVADTGNERILRFSSAADLANHAPAEVVIGQVNFSSVAPATTQTGLRRPAGIHVDSVGRLWVADSSNHRVLMWEGAAFITNGAPADKVFGQSLFTTSASATSSSGMNQPFDVFVDESDSLWVAEFENNRVLRFDDISNKPNGAPANGVLGQPDFVSDISATSASGMHAPAYIVGDSNGGIWVSDYINHRVIRFNSAAELENGADASQVLGQPDFETNISGRSSTRISFPLGLTVAKDGSLWVVDGSDRVLGFSAEATLVNSAAASVVLGQSDFTSGVEGTSASGMSLPFAVEFDGDGNLWVAESENHRAIRFSPTADPPAEPTPTLPPTPDVSSPSLSFAGSLPRITTKARLRIRGTTSDAVGAVQVQVRVNNRVIKTVSTTSTWSVRAKLKIGKNRIRVTSTDSSGNISRLSRVIRRKVR